MVNKRLINTGEAAAFDPIQNFETVTYTGNGSTQKITGYIRKGGAFNGSSSYINLGSINSFQTTNSVTVSLWFNASTDKSSFRRIFNSEGDSSFFLMQSYLNQTTGFLTVITRNSSGTFSFTGNVDYCDNNWHHLSMSIDYTNFKIIVYVDNSKVGDVSITNGSGNNTKIQIIGAQYTGAIFEQYFSGKIDQVRIFDKAISSSEVTTLYNETYASSTKSTTDIFNDGSGVALYELDEDSNSSNFGQAASFNGSSSYIDLGSISLGGTNNITVSMWVNPASSQTAYATIFDDEHENIGGFVIHQNNTSLNQYYIGGKNSSGVFVTSSNFSLTANAWNYLVVTIDSSGNYVIYVNNSVATSGSGITGFNTTISNPVKIGRYSASSARYWNGKIDQVRIYSSALSSGDVTNLYNESNVPTSGLVAHYKLDGNATDETGSYDGTETSITYSAGVYGGTPTNVNFLGMAFQPDLVWVKSRSNATSHVLSDSVRGANLKLRSNSTAAEAGTDYGVVTSFDTNGFTVGGTIDTGDVSFLNWTYVAWCWKAGGAAVSNTDGSITSQVSANPDAGFSIVSYTGNGIAGATVGHGLNQEPELIIPKNRDEAQSWVVGATVIGKSYILDLTNTNQALSRPNQYYYDWNSTTITMGSEIHTNGSADKIIAYCFHSVDGYQKVGSYSGSGSSDVSVTTGFRPRWVMIKRTDVASQSNPSGGGTAYSNWFIWDSTRDNTNPSTLYLMANESNVEGSNLELDFDDNGFTVGGLTTGGYWAATNASGGTYIYLAIA